MDRFVRIMWSPTPPRLFIPLRLHLLPHDRELSLSCRAFYFTWSKTLSFYSALYFTWSRTFSFLVLRFILRRRRNGGCMCTCVSMPLNTVCWSAVVCWSPTFFPLFSGRSYTESLVTQTERPSKNRLSFDYYTLSHSFVTALHSVVHVLFLSIRLPYPFDVSPFPNSPFKWL